MAYDIKVFNQRARDIRRLVRRGSPALVYSGPFGIAIVAYLKPETKWRIGQVMDRMAFIGRGDPAARVIAHKIASGEARAIAGKFSQGDVMGHEPALAISRVLQEHNHKYTLGPPLPVEACFVQLNATPEDDYLAYIPVDGNLRTFRKVWFLGESQTEEDAPLSTDTDSDPDSGSDNKAADVPDDEPDQWLNDGLADTLGNYASFADFWEALNGPDIPEPVRRLRNSPKLDIVILDRKAMDSRTYRQVFQRQNR